MTVEAFLETFAPVLAPGMTIAAALVVVAVIEWRDHRRRVIRRQSGTRRQPHVS